MNVGFILLKIEVFKNKPILIRKKKPRSIHDDFKLTKKKNEFIFRNMSFGVILDFENTISQNQNI